MAKSIFSIPGQPVIFSEGEDSCNCGSRMQCNLVVPGQQVYSQLKIEPCGEVDVCNNSVGDELVVNGSFEGETGWEEAGNNWTIAGGKACYTAADHLGILYQTISGLTVGNTYLLTFTISDYVSGTLTPFLWANNGAAVSADGDYSQYITLAIDTNHFLDFVDSNSWNGCITNISVVEVFSCWDSDETDWYFTSDGVCHNSGNTTDITNTGTTITSGKYYHITFSISGATAGGVTLKADTAAIGAQTSGNGVFERWGTADGAQVVFTPSSDFDGCISGLLIDEYCTGYEFHLTNSEGDYLSDLTPYFELNEDIYNLTNFHFEDDRNEFGCYKICLIDCCQTQHSLSEFITNGNFASGGASWTSSNVIFSGGNAKLGGGATNYISQAILTTSTANCLTLEFDFANIGEECVPIVDIYFDNILVDTLNTLCGAGSYSRTFENVSPGTVIKIQFTATAPYLELLTIDNVSVTLGYGCYLYDQCTNCFSYQAEFECTKLIEAWSDGDANNFQFDDANGNNFFKLSQRLRCELMHATYDQEQEDYTFSTGSSSVSLGQNTKYQSLYFSPIPTVKHDVIAVSKISDYIQVDGVDYFARKGDYTPEWNKTTNADLAPSRIDVKVKDQTTFNTNC